MTDRFARRYVSGLERGRDERCSDVARATVCGAILLAVMVVVMGSPQVAQAQAVGGVISEVRLFKAVDRSGGALMGDPYFAELCVSGPDIQSATVTPPGAGGSPRMMTFLEGQEFCLEQNFASFAALNMDFPIGSYVVSVTDNQMNVDIAMVDFQAAEPTAYPDFVFPASSVTLPAAGDLIVT